MNTKEQIELCSNALMNLLIEEMSGKDMSQHEPDVAGIFPISIALRKLEVFGIDVVIPDMILMILDICAQGNPAIIQLMTKELLMDVKANQGGSIPKGYIVTGEDFARLHGDSYPILDLPGFEEKYRTLWQAQKRERNKTFDSDNQCDSPEWWQEIL